MKNEVIELSKETTQGCLCFECKEHIAREIENYYGTGHVSSAGSMPCEHKQLNAFSNRTCQSHNRND